MKTLCDPGNVFGDLRQLLKSDAGVAPQDQDQKERITRGFLENQEN